MTSSYVSWSRVLLHSDPLMTRHENGTFLSQPHPVRALALLGSRLEQKLDG